MKTKRQEKMNLGEKIRFLRLQKKLSQGELAKELDYDKSTISKWEANIYDPDPRSIIRLCDFFEISTDYLLGRTPTAAAHRNDDPMSNLSPAALEFYQHVIRPIVEQEVENRLKEINDQTEQNQQKK